MSLSRQLSPRRDGRLLEIAVGVAIVVLVAGLTHLLAILLIPRVATKDAYHSLAMRGGTNRMSMLAPSTPGADLIPFADPATVQGICFYDVTKTPVRVRAHTEAGRLLTLSFRTPESKVFYSMTDRAALRGSIDIRLVTPEELQDIEDSDSGDDSGLPTELRLKVPGPRGLMVATALVERPSERQDAARMVSAITCAPEPLQPPP